MMGGAGVEFPIRGRTRAFVGAQIGAIGDKEYAAYLFPSLKLGVSVGLGGSRP